MTTYFDSEEARREGKSTEVFGKGLTNREMKRGKEYQLFIHIVDMLTEDCFNGMSHEAAVHSGAAPFVRRFGKRDYFYLKPEEEGIDGFPDFFVDRENIICIVDHFCIDSSSRREHAGDNGTEYLSLLGRNRGNLLLAQRSEEYRRMVFSPDSLKKTVGMMMGKKSKKTRQYESAVKTYIDRRGKEIAEIDNAKPMEIWLLVEDSSPEEERYSDIAIEQIRDKMDNYPNISGVIYAYCGYQNRLPHEISDIRFIVQDEIIKHN